MDMTMNTMNHPNSISDSEIQSFFRDQGAWQANERHEIVEKDTQSLKVTSTFEGQDPRWYDQCLRLAAQSSCCLCGKNPCDSSTKALVTFKPSQDLVGIWGICTECASSTTGQSKLKLYYHAWFAQIEKKIHPKWIGIMGTEILSFEEGLP
jgi:hypothetical protein